VINETLNEADQKMSKSVEATREEFAAIRAGRANPAMFAKISAEYYGTPTPLQQLASFTSQDARTIIVAPFDINALSDIEKAIRDSDLGLNPSTDGQIIRVVFPELTEERRRDYIKLARQRAEEGRIAVRNVRRHAKDALQKLEDDGDIGADEHDRHAKKLEELTADHVKRIDQLLEGKEQELLEV
jgi:ribosome recycling factor